jgi:TRAP-type C4-dicarboxylate transport system permease small subunit
MHMSLREGLYRALVWVGGGALLVAMAADTLAMLGRHLQLPLLGSIEIVQAAVLVAASGALLLATICQSHARVHLLLRRMPDGLRARFGSAHFIAAIVLMLALLAGSAWIARDLWSGHEESELLRIPWMPLRIIVVLLLAGLVAVLFRQLLRGSRA